VDVAVLSETKKKLEGSEEQNTIYTYIVEYHKINMQQLVAIFINKKWKTKYTVTLS
jgi:hypothetical protein